MCNCTDCYTPLHYAAYLGHEHVIEALLACDADVNALTSAGCTPVFLAAQQGHVHAVRLLLAAGAKPEIPEKAHGMTAVDVADSQVLQLFTAAPPAALPATLTHPGAARVARHEALYPGDTAGEGRFRPPPPMSCPSVSVFRSGAVGIRWDEPAITYAALLGGGGPVGGVPPPLDRDQLRKVQQGLALPITGYILQIVMCLDDGGRVLPEQALQAAQAASEGTGTPAVHGHGAGALRQLSGRRVAQHSSATSAAAGADADAGAGAGCEITSLAMLPGDAGHLTVRGMVIVTRTATASAQCKLTLSDTLLLGGVYRVRAAAVNALGAGGWSPLTPPLVVAKPPSTCPAPAALVMAIAPPLTPPAQGGAFTPNASLSETWAQDSHLQVGLVLPVDPEGPLAPLSGEMAIIQLEHREPEQSSSQPVEDSFGTEGRSAAELTSSRGPVSVAAGRTDITACAVVHWLGALGMTAYQVCPPSLYQQGASKAAQQSTLPQPPDSAAPAGFLDGGSEVQAWELAVWGTPPTPPRPTSVFKRLASSHRPGASGASAPRQLVARQRLHGELFFAALMGCRVGWTYTVHVSAINRCGPGPTSPPLQMRVPHMLHPLPPASCLPSAGGGEGGAEGGVDTDFHPPLTDQNHVPAPVEVPITSGFNTPAVQSVEQPPSGGAPSKPEGPSAGSAFSGRPVADVLAEDFDSTWGGGETAASDMVLQAGGGAAAGSAVAVSPIHASPTDSDAPRQSAVQPYDLDAVDSAGRGALDAETSGVAAHWLDAYSSQGGGAADEEVAAGGEDAQESDSGEFF